MIQSTPTQLIDIDSGLFIWTCTLITSLALIWFGHIDQTAFQTVHLGTTGLVLAGEKFKPRGTNG